ncbi:hypothetical protein [Sinanaerobacter sp. ZZT-01]|uniref:hypothetical protein n=1 Tax=Sinanaerobacter sp. ZZT-01 TaxID=3111540 RepID=UPI002D786398|nr:hypothetical protein [Sinanaerobacter sp. ZZT-01]WRR92473.1 hypothetical protein U5921_10460 [Sinanaerobacter sp. ZZT-01]
MVRMRTIEQAAKEIKKADQNTCITKYYIRSLVTTGQIPSKKSGSKFLINMDLLERFLREPTEQ